MLDRTAALPAAGVMCAAPSLLPLEVTGVTFEAGGKQLINGIDLKLAGAGRTVFMGPNGAGKSLLFRLLHGLIKPSSGSITWNGRPLDETVRKRQAMVFQRPVLLRRSVAANIRFALELRPFEDREERLSQALKLAGLEHLAQRPARVLSGGEQQRLALARALALEPEVLFLDEPTSSLDPGSVAAIEDIILGAADKGCKIMLVTHDRGQAERIADDVVFVHRGQVIEHTPADEFFRLPRTPQARELIEGRLVF